ncbi:MAG: SOS response-associated peptidase [Candidatus Izemoplasmatales bacterium]
MCGRFTITKNKEVVIDFLKENFNISNVEGMDVPRYNVGPGQDVISVIYDGERYRAGLIAWDYKINIKGQYTQLINARSETVHEKYAFKKAFKNKRCLILSDGFYEWDQESKQPYRFILKTNEMFFYAGIYDQFLIDNQKSFGALILTTKANQLVSNHHSRMPVILDVNQAKAFLREDIDLPSLQALLVPFSESKMHAYPVDTKVNKMSFDSPELIKKTTKD